MDQGILFDWPRKLSEKTPLIYPGAKKKGRHQLLSVIPAGVTHLASPFLGGGSFEVWAAAQGMRISGADNFEALASFWQELLKCSDVVAEHAEAFLPMNKEKFLELRDEYWAFDDPAFCAGLFWVLNRSAYGGIMFQSWSTVQRQYDVERVRNFYSPNMSVRCADWRDFCADHRDTFMYLDPPYIGGKFNGLYGEPAKRNAPFDHEALRRYLGSREGWILSYNDSPEARELYSGYQIEIPRWTYDLKNRYANQYKNVDVDDFELQHSPQQTKYVSQEILIVCR